jgi:uncharacterized protein (TIGR02117 family)
MDQDWDAALYFSGKSYRIPTRKPRIVAEIAALLAAWAVTCSVGASGTPDAADNLGFYVGSTGWHTSIVVPRGQIPTGTFPRGITERTFSAFPYLEIGWGDREFYTAPKPNVAMALHAAFLPGPSVLHVVGLKPPVERALPWNALVRVPCTRTEFASLCRALGATFERDTSGRARCLGQGLYGETSRFYQALGRYSLLNTCDTWTARMMRAGGLPANTSPAGTWSAGATIAQARRLGAQKLRAQRCDRVFDRVRVSIPQDSVVRSARSKSFSHRYSKADSRQPLQ